MGDQALSRQVRNRLVPGDGDRFAETCALCAPGIGRGATIGALYSGLLRKRLRQTAADDQHR
jgi:hypothetical protein